MPNLKEKIGAQLKGVKKEELKDYLARTGYAHQKLSKAAKVESSTSISGKVPKKFTSKTFVWIILLIVFVVWLINSVSEIQGSPVIQPIDIFTKETGEIVEIYSGTISKLSPMSITLLINSTTKTFPLSEENPVEYVIGEGPNKGEFIETAEIGDKVMFLFLDISSAERPYVLRVIIEGPHIN